MDGASAMRDLIEATYKARVDGDLEGTLEAFAEDTIYEFNGLTAVAPNASAPVHGKSALRPVMQSIIKSFEFRDWRIVSLLVDGDQAALRWRALVTFTASGKSAEFDVVDLIAVRDGKIAAFHQSSDTAGILAMSAP